MAMRGATFFILLLLLPSIFFYCVRASREGEGGEVEEGNPYYFGDQSFKSSSGSSKHGEFRVLQRFSERSRLLRGIDNYRLAILEAEPQTFILPNHWDAEELFYVMEGRGTISLLWEENRESHAIRRGDVMRIPAGAIVYLVNNDDNEKLRIALLLQPVSLSGRFQEFFGAGGRDPETFYTSFNNEVLEAAFNTTKEKLEKLFGQQKKGVIIKISEEQIKALSKQSSSTRPRPFSQSSWKPYNLLKQKPSHSNDHGELYEVTARDYRKLRDIDADVSIANISSGSMMVPNYNSKATKLAIVVEGRGYIEMVCPHVSKGRQGEQGQGTARYQRIRSELSTGSVFVIPASHPVVVVSRGAESLQLLCLGVGAENNKKYYLAGKNNILNRMEKVAKELAFDSPAKEVEEVLGAQKESVFIQGPEKEGRKRKDFPPESTHGFTGY